MRAFAILLLFANLAAWALLLWQRRDSGAAVQTVGELHFEPAGRELKLLDAARASLREASSTDIDAASTDAAVEGVVPDSAADSAPSVMQIEPWCGVSAMLEAEGQAAAWLDSWKSLGGEGQLTTTEEPVSSTWWVHLPPFDNEADARAVLKELQDKNIDSFYMRTGELTGGISLGVFAIRESAFLVQADMVRRGYSAEVREVRKMATRTRVSAKLVDRAMLERPAVQSYLRDSSFISLDEIPCE